jgi:hypothetical protein
MRIGTILGLLMILVSVGASAQQSPQMRDTGQDLNVPICGGFAGFICKGNQWCDFPANAACGIADQTGVCKTRPDVCTREFMPVCGCNGQTYSNACVAAASGFDVAYVGVCRGDSYPPRRQ